MTTGILKITTTTGVPSTAVAADFPTLNQSTTGSAATLTTTRAINGVNFDGSAAITITAAAGTLTGATLNSTVTASSLTSFGTSPTLVTPILGTPTSGTVTNLTGTASININGTVGAITPSTGAFTSVKAGTGTALYSGTLDVLAPNISLAAAIPQVGIYATDGIALDIGGSLGLGGKNGAGNPYPFAFLAGRSENSTFAGYMQFATVTAGAVATERMRITSAGNVGIGTTSPAHKLDVLGVSFKIYAGGTTTDTVLHIGNSDIASPGQGGLLTFHASAATPYFSINALSQGVAYRNIALASVGGNVGIGTTTPSWQTQVYGTGQNTALLTDGGSKSGSLFVGSSNGTTGAGGALLLGGVTANGVTSQWAIKSLITSTTANGTADLAFSTRAATSDTTLTERMRILATGEVGIGTTSPQFALDVRRTGTQGNTLVLQTLFNTESSYQVNSGSALLFQYGYGHSQAMISAHIESNGNGNNGYLSLRTTTDGGATMPERVRIASTGNVGIGTTSPLNPLQVTSTSNIRPIRASGALTDIGLLLDNTTAGGRGYSLFSSGTGSGLGVGNFNIYDEVAGTTRLGITSGGNVGIGTTSPATPLHVFGNTSNEIARFQPSNGAANTRGYISIYTTNPSYWWEISNQDAAGGGTSNNLSFNERSVSGAAVSRVFFGQGGNVGIGTMSPGYLLTVNGQPGANGYTAFTNYSDARLKTNISPLSDAADSLRRINFLNPVTYNYNELTGYDAATLARRSSGFIAQELKEQFPEMVGTVLINETEYLDTNLSDLNLHLVLAVKQLTILTNSLQNQIDALKKDIK